MFVLSASGSVMTPSLDIMIFEDTEQNAMIEAEKRVKALHKTYWSFILYKLKNTLDVSEAQEIGIYSTKEQEVQLTFRSVRRPKQGD